MNPSALMLLYRDSEAGMTLVPFVHRDGNLPELIEQIADYLWSAGIGEAFIEGVVTDLKGVVLRQRVENKALRDEVKRLNGILGQTPIRELVGGAA